MNKNDRTKELFYELLRKFHKWNRSIAIRTKEQPQNINEYVDKVSKRYDIYLKYQDNEFKDE